MKNIIISMLSIVALLATSCGDDEDPIPVNPEEVITTVVVTLTPTSGTPVILRSEDLDADGPNPPVVTVSGDLMPTTAYTGTIQFLDETEAPAEDITEEVEDEAVDHQVFYQIGGSLELSVTYTDTDTNGNPIGLTFNALSGNASTGTFLVTLRHEPDKNATGVSDGDIANAGGETDVAQSFDLTIQ
jgi:hypothetical protein